MKERASAASSPIVPVKRKILPFDAHQTTLSMPIKAIIRCASTHLYYGNCHTTLAVDPDASSAGSGNYLRKRWLRLAVLVSASCARRGCVLRYRQQFVAALTNDCCDRCNKLLPSALLNLALSLATSCPGDEASWRNGCLLHCFHKVSSAILKQTNHEICQQFHFL
jgi:hypothetical protein